MGKYKCLLHFYSAAQGLAVPSFLGQHAREAPGSRVSLKKAHSALSHVAFRGPAKTLQKKTEQLQLWQGCYNLMPKQRVQLGEHLTGDYK